LCTLSIRPAKRSYGQFAMPLVAIRYRFMRVPRAWTLLYVAAALYPVTSSAQDFATEIQPLLKARCFSCHGDKLQMHGLRLDRKADALKGGESGAPALVPGNSAKSLLFQYVAGLNKDVVMPPVGPRLTSEQIALLRNWIDGGADWKDEANVIPPPM